MLSHAHYDHANGMPRFFKENSKAKFYLRETTEENCYFKKYIFRKYIGIPKHILMDYSERIEKLEPGKSAQVKVNFTQRDDVSTSRYTIQFEYRADNHISGSNSFYVN